MQSILLLYPHQLFASVITNNDRFDAIWLIEDPLYFGTDAEYPLAFHKQKLVLHRATMQSYAQHLPKHKVTYVSFDQPIDLPAKAELYYYDVVDFVLRQRIHALPHTKHELPSPNFYLHREDIPSYFDEGKQLFASFYTRRRKELGILVTDADKPVGGKWSFDAENRRKLAKNITVPSVPVLLNDEFITEAKSYVDLYFSDNPGNYEAFNYPINHADAEKWLHTFLKERLDNFGPYEDALTNDYDHLFHSVLTPMLNIGLLSPQQIVEALLVHVDTHDVPLASYEGFLRQIIGWREYMRGIYEVQGRTMRKTNFFNHTNRLSDAWYDGTTGIEPFDDLTRKLMRSAYGHHIERLMIAGNLMLLSRLHPDEVYRWFMELFIDAYDWVMVPNVYGMSQFADGGNIVTKPYISGSNYLRKMSNYKTDVYADIWDGLYWKFIADHRDLFKKNQRMSMMATMLDKMDNTKKERIFAAADNFIATKTNTAQQ